MKKLDMTDYIPTEVDVPNVSMFSNNVAVPKNYCAEEAMKNLKEEIRKTDPEFIKRLEEF